LLEKARIPMQLDVAFGDVVHPRPHSLPRRSRASHSDAPPG
jgi:hypothetical protein